MAKNSRISNAKDVEEVSRFWVTLKEFEHEGNEQLEAFAIAFLAVLKFLNSKGLLRLSGKRKLVISTRAQALRLGLFRHDVTSRGTRFLDYCGKEWLADRIIFESVMPSNEHPYHLVDLWERWTNEKEESFKKQLRKLLKGSDDFNLCNHVFLMLDSSPHLFVARETKLDELQVVRFVWGATGLIDNGGFEYLFEGDCSEDPDLTRTRMAFEAIGCKPAVRAFDRAFSNFKGGKPTKSSRGRTRIFQRVPPKTRKSINRQFWKAGWDGLISKLLAEYIRTHQDVFEVEPPRPLQNQD